MTTELEIDQPNPRKRDGRPYPKSIKMDDGKGSLKAQRQALSSDEVDAQSDNSTAEGINELIALRERNYELLTAPRTQKDSAQSLDSDFSYIAYDTRSIYEPHPNPSPENPDILYLYYIDMDCDGFLRVMHLSYEPGRPIVPGADVEAAIDYTAMTAMRLVKSPDAIKEEHVYLHRSINFENLLYDRKCYIAFVLGRKAWRFHTDRLGRAAIRFVYKVEGASTPIGPNEYFYDGMDMGVDVSYFGGGERRAGFYMTNHVDGSGPLQSRRFKFDIFVDVLFAVRGVGSAEKTIVIDPTGENQGPPV